MRQVTRKSLITVAAAGGVLALSGGAAYADAGAQGAAEGSPGVLSGNNVQVPVHVPVNVCGNSVDVVGILNPTFGNKCVNGSDHADKHKKSSHKRDHSDAAGTRSGGAGAQGAAEGSPGVGSGNNIQIPVDLPVNACGNTVNVISVLNPAFGNECDNHASPVDTHTPNTPHHPDQPGEDTPDKPVEHKPAEQPNTPTTQTVAHPQLAETGSDVSELGVAAALSAGMLLGGTVLYRRGRAVRQR